MRAYLESSDMMPPGTCFHSLPMASREGSIRAVRSTLRATGAMGGTAGSGSVTGWGAGAWVTAAGVAGDALATDDGGVGAAVAVWSVGARATISRPAPSPAGALEAASDLLDFAW